MKLKNWPWIPFALLAIGIGLYPVAYYLVDMRTAGLLSTKPKTLLASGYYLPVFYVHITFGGIALLTGWSQFSRRLRERRLGFHRLLGKIYIGAVILSSVAGLFISFFASGGIICSLGFGLLAMLWLFSAIKSYTSILRKAIRQHQNWMIYNYALAFAAVTLRIYLPFSQAVMHVDFITAYRVISWLCWVPNLFVAAWIIKRAAKQPAYAAHLS